MKCPRCGHEMDYRKETETFDRNYKAIQTYYKCPICGYRINDQYITLSGVNGSLRISVRTTVRMYVTK